MDDDYYGQTDDEAADRRHTNSKGDPCPGWCITDHSAPVIPGKPEHGLAVAHWSGISAHTDKMMVRLTKWTGADADPEICLTTVYGADPLFITTTQAGNLVKLLEASYGEGDELAGLLRTAAAAVTIGDPA